MSRVTRRTCALTPHSPIHRRFASESRAWRAVRVPAHEIASTVSVWLAELGARSPLAEELARAVHTGNWAAVRGISEYLSIDIALT